jgi:hypothetical protein
MVTSHPVKILPENGVSFSPNELDQITVKAKQFAEMEGVKVSIHTELRRRLPLEMNEPWESYDGPVVEVELHRGKHRVVIEDVAQPTNVYYFPDPELEYREVYFTSIRKRERAITPVPRVQTAVAGAALQLQELLLPVPSPLGGQQMAVGSENRHVPLPQAAPAPPAFIAPQAAMVMATLPVGNSPQPLAMVDMESLMDLNKGIRKLVFGGVKYPQDVPPQNLFMYPGFIMQQILLMGARPAAGWWKELVGKCTQRTPLINTLTTAQYHNFEAAVETTAAEIAETWLSPNWAGEDVPNNKAVCKRFYDQIKSVLKYYATGTVNFEMVSLAEEFAREYDMAYYAGYVNPPAIFESVAKNGPARSLAGANQHGARRKFRPFQESTRGRGQSSQRGSGGTFRGRGQGRGRGH